MPSDEHYVWCAYAKAGVTVFVLGFLGILTGRVWTCVAPGTVAVLGPWVRIVGAALVLWSVLARLGWSIQTWEGNTSAERVNNRLFYTLHVLGVLCLISSMSAMAFG